MGGARLAKLLYERVFFQRLLGGLRFGCYGLVQPWYVQPMSDCLFCKIIEGKIPATVAHKDEHSLGFLDINPQAPLHALFVPLKHVGTLNDATVEDREMLGHLMFAAAKVAREKGFADTGYRTVMNCNREAGQTVFHVHLHLLAGRPMSWPPG